MMMNRAGGVLAAAMVFAFGSVTGWELHPSADPAVAADFNCAGWNYHKEGVR